MSSRLLISLLSALIFAACSDSESIPQKPQIKLSPESIQTSSYVNSTFKAGVQIQNMGIDPLIISDVQLSGDGAFTRIEGPSKTTLNSRESAFVQLAFTPTQVKAYSATLTITSNAENQATATVSLQGDGLANP
jgi:hypothetical protein